MSIWHNLKFESHRSAEEILRSLLSSSIGFQPATYDQMKTDGLFGRVFPIDNQGQRHFTEENGFSVNMRVTFEEDSDGDIEEGYQVMGRTISLILEQEQGNLMFFWVVDTPILKRLKGEKIQVTDGEHFDWLRTALSEFNLVFDLVPKGSIER